MNAIAASSGQLELPPLRQELRLEPGAAEVGGAPTWTLFDPVRHLFFQLGRIEFTIFSRWASGSFAELERDLASEGLSEAEADASLRRVVEFSLEHQLAVAPLGDTVATMKARRDAQKRAWWRWLVDNYLFIRLPLVRPARWLEKTLPHIAFLWSPLAIWGFALLALFDLLMVSRQWDAFMASFLYFFSWEGVVAYALGLSAVKVIHELGHAYTATRYGCRVASMGVSFLVMMPVLYTDTSSAWRLRSRMQRVAIDCAGVGAELMVAAVSTFVWLWLPDGSLRSTVFVLATSSWILSLAINLNPFTRFDGYYVLADLIGVPNLQPRSFALGRWRLRELLFNLGHPPPEHFPQRMRRFLVGYAWVTWAYRFVLFLGIALLVYHLFFKLLGIVLFVVEMAVFIVRPIIVEIKAWRGLKGEIWRSRRGRKVLGGAGLLLLLACLPLDRHVSAPALLAPIEADPLVPGDPARIEAIHVRDGQRVKQGQVIAELSAPALAASQSASRARIAGLEQQLARAASDAQDRANRAVIERQLAVERANLAGAGRQLDRLVLRAPVDGVVTDLAPDMHPGRWLGGAEVVARVVRPGHLDVQAYLPEDDFWRIEPDATGRFVPDDLAQPSRKAKLAEQAQAAVQYLDQPLLASVNGGPIAVNKDGQGRLKPREAIYRLRFLAAVDESWEGNGIVQPQTGRIVVKAEGRSVIGGLLRQIAQILRREASLT